MLLDLQHASCTIYAVSFISCFHASISFQALMMSRGIYILSAFGIDSWLLCHYASDDRFHAARPHRLLSLYSCQHVIASARRNDFTMLPGLYFTFIWGAELFRHFKELHDEDTSALSILSMAGYFDDLFFIFPPTLPPTSFITANASPSPLDDRPFKRAIWAMNYEERDNLAYKASRQSRFIILYKTRVSFFDISARLRYSCLYFITFAQPGWDIFRFWFSACRSRHFLYPVIGLCRCSQHAMIYYDDIYCRWFPAYAHTLEISPLGLPA